MINVNDDGGLPSKDLCLPETAPLLNMSVNRIIVAPWCSILYVLFET